jgi:hypothetical protein
MSASDERRGGSGIGHLAKNGSDPAPPSWACKWTWVFWISWYWIKPLLIAAVYNRADSIQKKRPHASSANFGHFYEGSFLQQSLHALDDLGGLCHDVPGQFVKLLS